jgi:predicted RND superfamily exporter protein
MSRIVSIAGATARRPAVALAVALVFTALAAGGLRLLRSDNSPRVYFEKDAPGLAGLARLQETFGGGDVLRFVVPGAPSSTTLEELDRIAVEARGVPGVVEAIGPRDSPGVSEFLRSGAEVAGETGVLTFLARDPFARDLGLWSGGAASAVVTLTGDLEPRERDAALDRLVAISRRQGFIEGVEGAEGAWVGSPALSRAFDRSADEIARVWFPLLAVVAVALLAFLFRSAAWIAAPLAYVGVCEALTLGAAGALGIELNLVVSILPPLLFVIALATALHLATRVRALLDEGASSSDNSSVVPVNTAIAAVEEAYREKGAAILWTTLSAGVGFGSLALSSVPPVAALGRLAVGGLAVVAALAFLLLPALLALAARRGAGRRREESLGAHGVGLAEGSARALKAVLWAVAGIALVAAFGFPRLRVESDGMRYLAESDPLRRATATSEAAGIGLSAVEWTLETGDRFDARFDDGAGVNLLSWVGLRLSEDLAESGVLSVASAGSVVDSVLAAAGEAAMGGREPRDVALRGLRASAEGRRALAAFVNADGRTARLTMFVRSGGYPELDAVLERSRAIFEEELPGVRATPTGPYVLLLETQRHLLRTLGTSFLATIGGVVAILYLLLRRFRLTLLALIPNVLPVWLVLGVMGWAGIPLDLATVMVASTTLGLALDDTLHTLVPFRRHVGERGSFEALLHAVEKNAAAYSASGLVLGLGFLVCALSDFAPIRRFGGLSALAIALAVSADFLLVPALLGGLPEHWVVPGRRGQSDKGRSNDGASSDSTDP